MPQIKDFTFPSGDGFHNIHVRSWAPDGDAKAVVQLSHGVAEHIGRYDAFGEYLASMGFLVVGNDHLGHGMSVNAPSELGYFAMEGGWELVTEDMHRLHELTAAEHPSLPYFLFGHSMGSFLARTYLILHPEGLAGAVISGTGMQSPVVVRAGLAAARLDVKRNGVHHKSEFLNNMAFGGYNRAFPFPRTVSDWLSRDEAVVDSYIADPLCGWVPTAGLFRDMMGGLAFIADADNLALMDMSTPVLFISGENDPVGENGRGVMRAYESFVAAGMQDVTLKLYHGGRHEMLNELNRDEVFADVGSWLVSKLP